MAWSQILGQPRAVETLRKALHSGALHHAWLFAGPEGVGKELTARAFAQALVCPEAPLEGCGACDACGRVARGNHPDVLWVMSEDEQIRRKLAGRADFTHVPSRDLKIEQVRALQERLSLRPLESKTKVAVVVDADALTDQAQNAFLKTLEEPPASTLLVLVSSAPEKLLPTIRSRLLRVPFGPLPKAQLAAFVEKERKLPKEKARWVAAMADGSLSRALSLDVEGLGEREELIGAYEKLGPKDASAILAFAERYGGSREDAEEALRQLQIWTRDVAAKRAGGALVNEDLEGPATAAASAHDEFDLFRRFRLLEDARYLIAERNAQPRLQLERVLLELLGAA